MQADTGPQGPVIEAAASAFPTCEKDETTYCLVSSPEGIGYVPLSVTEPC